MFFINILEGGDACAKSSVLNQKFVDEVSPDASGRKNVAHGVSRG
jgi:hypothetical protein